MYRADRRASAGDRRKPVLLLARRQTDVLTEVVWPIGRRASGRTPHSPSTDGRPMGDLARPRGFRFLQTASKSFNFFPRRLPKASIPFQKLQKISANRDLSRGYGRMQGGKNFRTHPIAGDGPKGRDLARTPPRPPPRLVHPSSPPGAKRPVRLMKTSIPQNLYLPKNSSSHLPVTAGEDNLVSVLRTRLKRLATPEWAAGARSHAVPRSGVRRQRRTGRAL